ncbi:MAG TPA: CocE/NonD family hydrolase [Solirubrobacteraceae bacterium]
MRRIALLLAICLLGGGVTADAAPAAKKPLCKVKAKTKQGKRKQAKLCKKKTPTPPDLRPRDYTQTAGLSQPAHTDIETVTRRLVMADGTDIYLEITKPKDATKLGVILEASPYHGTLYARTGTRILPLPERNGRPIGLTGYFPKRGYAVVMMDVRGTGRSGGCLDHLGPDDQSDLKAVIEWAAAQPWSNGRVGMLGHSYVGSTPIIATKHDPKGLVTIVPSAGLAAMYDHQFQAGVAFNLQWAGPIFAYELLAFDRELPPGIPDPVSGGETGDDFGGHPLGAVCGLQNSAGIQGLGQLTGVQDAFHKERDAAKEAAAWGGTVFAVHGVHDEAARISNLYWLARRGGRTTDKLWIGQWDHGIGCCPNQRGAQWLYALHAWMDRQLLQRKVDTGPPVEAFVNTATNDAASIEKREQIVTAPSWPVPGTRMVDFAPEAGGTLVRGAPSGAGGSASFLGDPLGFQLGADATGSVAFTSAPLTEDLVLLGTPALDLVAATTNPRADLIANVYDVAPNGQKRRLSQFAINPLVREGIDHLAPARPGARYTLRPPGFPMAHRLPAGHKLVLRVQTSDPDKVPLGVGDLRVSVFYGADGTVLRLPVLDRAPLYADDKPVAKALARP